MKRASHPRSAGYPALKIAGPRLREETRLALLLAQGSERHAVGNTITNRDLYKCELHKDITL